MKKNVLILTIIVSTAGLLSAQETFERFDYSHITKSDGWSSLTRAERVDKCNLSMDQVKLMTTYDLLRAIYDYPFLIDLIAYNSLEYGYNSLKAECKYLQELLSRSDIEKDIILAYSNLFNSYKESTINDFDKSSFSNFHFILLEYIIGRPEILQKFCTESKLDLLKLVTLRRSDYNKLLEKEGAGSVSSFSININTSLICGIILETPDLQTGIDERLLEDIKQSNMWGAITSKRVHTQVETKISELEIIK